MDLGTHTPREKFRPFRLYTEDEMVGIRRKRFVLKAFFLIALAVTAAGYLYSFYHSYFEHTKVAQLMTRSAPLSAKIGGKVAKVLVNDTQVVKTGDLLVQLEAKEFQATNDEAARALKKVEDQITGGRSYLEHLREKAGESDAARKKYDDSRVWYGHLQSKVQELRARAAETKAQLDSAMIYAPSDGHIAQKTVEVGAVVGAGQPLLNFVDSGQPWVIASFKEVELLNIRVGQRAEVSVAGIDKTFTGKVESVAVLENPPTPPTKFEKLMFFFIESGTRQPVKIAFDAKSIQGESNKMVSGAATEVKVFIK